MVLLGSTGSIGVNTLQVAREFGIKVEVLCAGRNITLLNEQIQAFKPKIVVIQDRADEGKLNPQGAKVLFSQEGIKEAIESCESSLIINALVGIAGLYPSYIAMQCQKTLALANKESLVTAGWLFEGYPIIPIDSEHFGIWYLLNDRPIESLIITASGGAFRDLPLESIPSQKAAAALKHPNWKMGNKITIDSATMLSKLFEILEARWLFNHTRIDALIERTSSIHALLSFKDGSLSAHFASPDMKLPISYALDPQRATQSCFIPPLCPTELPALRLEPIDPARYPLWRIKEEILRSPKLGAILNAGNEILVQSFLEDKIPFGAISSHIFRTLEHFAPSISSLNDLESILELDKEVRIYTQNLL